MQFCFLTKYFLLLNFSDKTCVFVSVFIFLLLLIIFDCNFEESNGPRLSINDLVSHRSKGKSLIRYIGEIGDCLHPNRINNHKNISSANCIQVTYGIELLESMGKNSGYNDNNDLIFRCKMGRGLFCTGDELKLIKSSEINEYIVNTAENGDDGTDAQYDSDDDFECSNDCMNRKIDSASSNDHSPVFNANTSNQKQTLTTGFFASQSSVTSASENEEEKKLDGANCNPNEIESDEAAFFKFLENSTGRPRSKHVIQRTRAPSEQETMDNLLSQCMFNFCLFLFVCLFVCFFVIDLIGFVLESFDAFFVLFCVLHFFASCFSSSAYLFIYLFI